MTNKPAKNNQKAFIFMFGLILSIYVSEIEAFSNISEVIQSLSQRINLTNLEIEELIPGWFNYKYDGGAHFITDGGNDMFDNGNIVNFEVAKFKYLVNGITYDEDYIYDSFGFTSIKTHPFLALLWVGETSTLQTAKLNVRGNAGADNHGYINGISVSSIKELNYDIQYSTTQISYAGTDPSICEVYFVLYNNQFWDSTVLTESTKMTRGRQTNILSSSIETKGKNFFLGYFLLSKLNAASVSQSEVTLVLRKIVAHVASVLPKKQKSVRLSTVASTQSSLIQNEKEVTDEVTAEKDEVFNTNRFNITIQNIEDIDTTQNPYLDIKTTKPSNSQDTTTKKVEQLYTTMSSRKQNIVRPTHSKSHRHSSRLEKSRKHHRMNNVSTQPIRFHEVTTDGPTSTTNIIEDRISDRDISLRMKAMVLNILEAYKNWTTSTYGRYRAGDRSNIRGSVEILFKQNGNRLSDYMLERQNYMFFTSTNYHKFALMMIDFPEVKSTLHELIVNTRATSPIAVQYPNLAEIVYEYSNNGYKIQYSFLKTSPQSIDIFFTISSDKWNSYVDRNQTTDIFHSYNLREVYSVFGNRILSGFIPFKLDRNLRIFSDPLKFVTYFLNDITRSESRFPTLEIKNQTYQSIKANYNLNEPRFWPLPPFPYSPDRHTPEPPSPRGRHRPEPPSPRGRHRPEPPISHRLRNRTELPVPRPTNLTLSLNYSEENSFNNFEKNYQINSSVGSDVNSFYKFSSESEFMERIFIFNSSMTLKVKRLIRLFHHYKYDGGDDRIRDGGDDMYDYGNLIRLKVDDMLPTSIRYNTFYRNDYYSFASSTGYPFYAFMFANSSDNQIHRYNITVYGNAGADGSGEFFYWNDTLSDSMCEIDYSVFQLSTIYDATICEVYFTLSCLEWNSIREGVNRLKYSDDADTLRSEFTSSGNRYVIGYFLLSKPFGVPIQDQEIRQFLIIIKRDIPNLFSTIPNENKNKYFNNTKYDSSTTNSYFENFQNYTTPYPFQYTTRHTFETTSQFNRSAYWIDLHILYEHVNQDYLKHQILDLIDTIESTTVRIMGKTVSNFYVYNYDGESSYISDGGMDMYDRGNYVKLTVDDWRGITFNYNSFYQNLDYMFISIKNHPFISLVIANSLDKMDHRYTLKVYGDVGADGQGDEESYEGTATLMSCLVEYTVFQIFAANDPSICEVYFSIFCPEQWNSSKPLRNTFNYSSGRNSLENTFEVFGNRFVMGYFLLSKVFGEKVTEGEVDMNVHILARAIIDVGLNFSSAEIDGNITEIYSKYRNSSMYGDSSVYDDDRSYPVYGPTASSYRWTSPVTYVPREPIADENGKVELLEKVFNSMSNKTEKMLKFIDQFYKYYYDSDDGNSIVDGGNDMYDNGNIVTYAQNSEISEKVKYGQIYVEKDFVFSSSVGYPFMALMWINSTSGDSNNTYSITVDGNAGADGFGNDNTMEGTVYLGLYRLDFHVFQIHSTSDPSICEVYFVIRSETWNSVLYNRPVFSHAPGTDILEGYFEVNGNQIFAGYLLLSKLNGARVTEREIRAFLNPFLLKLIESVAGDPSISIDVPENDYAISQTCLVSQIVEQFYDSCLFKNKWLENTKYTGARGCRFHVNKLFNCAANTLMDCTWSLRSNDTKPVDFLEILNFFRQLGNEFYYRNTTNNALDVFCYHAPLGLEFPYPAEEIFKDFCGSNFTNVVLVYLSKFYRLYTWSRSDTETFRAFNLLVENLQRLIQSRCTADNFSGFSRNLPEYNQMQKKFEKLLKAFLKALSEMRNKFF